MFFYSISPRRISQFKNNFEVEVAPLIQLTYTSIPYLIACMKKHYFFCILSDNNASMQSLRKNKAMMSFTGRERVMAPVPQTQYPERGEKRFSKIKK